MTTDQSNCTICGLSKRTKKKGSITQWIAICKCDLKDDVSSNYIECEVCKKCGKRIKTSRSGSMTQWIFRSDLCDCKTPEPQDAVVEVPFGIEKESINSFDDDEVEIDVDQSMFPLDRYKPLKEIGKGSVGLVYLCRDRFLGVKVAIKCLSTISSENLIAFQKEAKITSKLEHSNIVKVIDFGASETGAPYMVMEYVDGVTLKELIESHGPLPIEEAIQIVSLLSSALFYAHGKGVFHRDLTSSNIIITDSSTAIRLVDFGIALAQQATQDSTKIQGRTVAGTPAYMPPDQVKGYDYTERSEIYSLGCVLFEALTGQAPFLGETALAVIGMHANKELPDLSLLRPELSKFPKVIDLVEKALEKEPKDRFQSMAEFESALKSALEDKPQESQKSALASAGEGSKGGAKNFLLIAVSIFLLIGATAGIVVLANRLPGIFSRNDINTIKVKKTLSEEMISVDLANKSSEDTFNQKSLDYIIGEPQAGPGKLISNGEGDNNFKSPGVKRFTSTSIMFGSSVAHLSGDKLRFDWQAVMAFFVIAPDYDTLLVQDLITLYSYSIPVDEYYFSQWKHNINQKVENVKYLGEEKLLGVNCRKYSCLIDGIKMRFSASKGLTKDSRLEDTCSKILGVPPGYGIPFIAYKTYNPTQLRDVEFMPVRNRILSAPGEKEKTVLWFKMKSFEKDVADLPLNKLFPENILKGDVDSKR